MIASDEVKSEVVADGELTTLRAISITNMETDHDLTLTAGDQAGTYTVSGQAQGKEVSASFEAKGGLPDFGRLTKSTAAYMRSDEPGELAVRAFIPSIDPTMPTAVSLRRVEPAEDGWNAVARIGLLEVKTSVDADGTHRREQIRMGPMTVGTERKWRAGTPP